MNPPAFQLIAAPFTPMAPDGSLDPGRIPLYFNFLKSRGVNGAFVCGTTGEGALLTASERREVVDAWVKAKGGDTSFRIFAHVGNECPAISVQLAEHAAAAGADAVAIVSPTFFKPQDERAAVEQAAVVAAAASSLPFYFYHIPSMSGLLLSIPRLIELAQAAIPNFAGVKFTHSDLGEFSDSLEAAGDGVEILFGRDELLLPALAAGALGAVGSTYNFASPLYRRLIDCFERGDLLAARKHQIEARKMIQVVVRYGLPGQKAAMGLAGVECGPSRLPLRNIGPSEKVWLAENLKKEWIS